MSSRRAVVAARFLKPPGYMKRMMMREKPRDWTGPYENPVRKMVRLREKSRQFCELPPPRKIPFPKPPPPKNILTEIEDVPDIDPIILQRRINFLLSDRAIEQQLHGPLRKGITPYQAELFVWERQMREIRRCYRWQYLQKLEEVTKEEKVKEKQLQDEETTRRKERKQFFLIKAAEDRKRRAILKDRLRIDKKVNQILMMQRRSKLKKKRLLWIRKLEKDNNVVNLNELDFSKLLQKNKEKNKDNNPDIIKNPDIEKVIFELNTDNRVDIFDRDISIPHLMRQVGGAKEFPKQKNMRIGRRKNIFREILEASYKKLPEDAITEDELEQTELRSSPHVFPEVEINGVLKNSKLSGTKTATKIAKQRQRAQLEYGVFTKKEQIKMLDEKIKMLKESLAKKETLDMGVHDHVQQLLLDQLITTKLAMQEEETLIKEGYEVRDDNSAFSSSEGSTQDTRSIN